VQVGSGTKPDSGVSGNVQFQFGVQWGTSTTVSKENVSINNLSLTSEYRNDATWQFLPRRPEVGGQKDACQNFGLRNLSDLAHTTFQPATAFIVRINKDFVGQTLQIQSDMTWELERSRIKWSDCVFTGCDCFRITTVKFLNGPSPEHVDHPVAIPLPPE